MATNWSCVVTRRATPNHLREAVEQGWQGCSGVIIDYEDHLSLCCTYDGLATEKGSNFDYSQSREDSKPATIIPRHAA